jgi:hypothetical protein
MAISYRDPRKAAVQAELRRQQRLEDPLFRLEALEHRVAHIEEFLAMKWPAGGDGTGFRPLKNEDLL